MTFDKFFWFSQPSLILTSADKELLWIFAGLTLLGIIFKIAEAVMHHAVLVKLYGKLGAATFWMGISGLIWYVLRYENTPVLADRYWAGLTLLCFIIWLLAIVWFVFTKFRVEKREYDRQMLNSRYIPGSRK
ncbi:MAG TPA: hypothetical protein VFX17_03075 [Patescibacteria group bacterium]|nr:hypothetical protein [Patescibacteria group bacterium]